MTEELAGESLFDRSNATIAAIEREMARQGDPLLELANLRSLLESVASVAAANARLQTVADAAVEYLAAEFEDEAYFVRDKLRAAVTAWAAMQPDA